jgi:hypothetical protein
MEAAVGASDECGALDNAEKDGGDAGNTWSFRFGNSSPKWKKPVLQICRTGTKK